MLGGKISGAGGGGYMFLYCPFETQPAITERLEELGATLVGFSFERRGLQTWETELSQMRTLDELMLFVKSHRSQLMLRMESCSDKSAL